MREETRCRHIGYSFRLAARVLLYANWQNSTYHGLCYTSRGTLAGTRNSSMGPPHEGSIRRPIAPWANALTNELHLAPCFMETRSFWTYLIVREGSSPPCRCGAWHYYPAELLLQLGEPTSGYLIRQDNTLYKLSIQLSFSSMGQVKWKLHNYKKLPFQLR